MDKQKQILKDLEKKLNGKNFEDIGEAIQKIQDLHSTVRPLEKWEYLKVKWWIHEGDFESWLNANGQDGWELVYYDPYSCDYADCIFKRKIQQG